jgi:hypothetical protein
LPPDFFISSANCSKRYSNASPKISVPSRSEFLSIGELVIVSDSVQNLTAGSYMIKAQVWSSLEDAAYPLLMKPKTYPLVVD